MDVLKRPKNSTAHFPIRRSIGFDYLRSRLRHWQQVRTWARLIREAESLWHVDVRELRRVAELELSQLLCEVPPKQRQRVNRWLGKYSVATRLYKESKDKNNEILLNKTDKN